MQKVARLLLTSGNKFYSHSDMEYRRQAGLLGQKPKESPKEKRARLKAYAQAKANAVRSGSAALIGTYYQAPTKPEPEWIAPYMEKLENQSRMNDGARAKKLRQRIQHEIDLGFRNPDGTPKVRLIRKNRPVTPDSAGYRGK